MPAIPPTPPVLHSNEILNFNSILTCPDHFTVFQVPLLFLVDYYTTPRDPPIFHCRTSLGSKLPISSKSLTKSSMPLYNISLTRKTNYLLVLYLHTTFPRSNLAKVGSYAGCECVDCSLETLLSPYISENRGFGNPLPKFGMGLLQIVGLARVEQGSIEWMHWGVFV